MRIVVLDGHTLNPGDLSWDQLLSLGTCSIYERTPSDQILVRAEGADALLTNKTPLTRDTLTRLPSLRYIGVLATGHNIVDGRAASEQGIIVTNVPAYSTMSVTQVVFAHLFSLTHHMGHHIAAVRDGRWCAQPDFSFWDRPLTEVAGLTMGIIGLGRIGSAVAQVALALDMHVVAVDRRPASDCPREVRMVPLDELFRISDVLTLHCPLTPETEGLVNRTRLALMKPTALIINTSRGPVIDEQALTEALNAGSIAGAGLDVLSMEPPRPDNPLLSAPNCSITPHFAWASTAARARLLEEVATNLRAFLAGTPRNVVNR